MTVVRVDKGLCMAHGACMQLAPDVFEPDDDGYAALVGGRAEVELTPAVLLAEASCPMQAISLVHPPATPGPPGG